MRRIRLDSQGSYFVSNPAPRVTHSTKKTVKVQMRIFESVQPKLASTADTADNEYPISFIQHKHALHI